MSTNTTTLEHPDHQAKLLDKTSFGFWVYLMTDLVLFATLFATFAVMRTNVASGAPLSEHYNLPFVLVETLLLLTSSFTCGLALLAVRAKQSQLAIAGFGITFALGACFLGMELYEFRQLVIEGNSWRASGALSSFFTLVGTHGAHITIGLLWIGVMMWRLATKPIDANTVRRLTILSLFWHFLDIVWIFIFTMVYLLGAAS